MNTYVPQEGWQTFHWQGRIWLAGEPVHLLRTAIRRGFERALEVRGIDVTGNPRARKGRP